MMTRLSASTLQIISRSSVTFPATRQVFRLGEPINVRVRIETCNAWAQSIAVDPVVMMYDVIADKEGWLIAGPKRGSYVADVSNLFIFSPARTLMLVFI